MKALLHSVWLGFLLTVHAAGARADEAVQVEAKPPLLNLNVPSQTGNRGAPQPAEWQSPARSSSLQRLRYGSGYEARQGDPREPTHRAPMAGGRRAGRGR